MKAIPSRVAFKLSEGLRQNTTLRVLDLEDCELAQKVVEDLADMLAINGTLERRAALQRATRPNPLWHCAGGGVGG